MEHEPFCVELVTDFVATPVVLSEHAEAWRRLHRVEYPDADFIVKIVDAVTSVYKEERAKRRRCG